MGRCCRAPAPATGRLCPDICAFLGSSLPKSTPLARRPLLLGASLVFACCALPRSAQAQYSLSQEYSEGFSLLRFEPTPAGDRFFGVRDAFVPGNLSSRFRAA